jgi:hypothetical protein
MPVYAPIIGSFGSIFIARSELLALRSSMKLNQFLSERVNTAVLVIPQANHFDYFYLTLRVDSDKFIQWRNYFINAPSGLQQTLLFDNSGVGVLSIALEEMTVDVEKIVNDGTGQYDYIYKLELTFVRSI